MKVIDVNKRHPIYTEILPYWHFYKRSYEGQQSYVPNYNYLSLSQQDYSSVSYLDRFSNEPQEKYVQRHNRSCYVNLCAPIVNRFTRYIFSDKTKIIRSTEPDEAIESWYPYIDNIDLRGTTMTNYMKSLHRDMLVYGVCYSLCNSAKLSENSSIGDERESGLRAWFDYVSPFNVLNWSFNSLTKAFDWVLISAYGQNISKEFGNHEYEQIYWLLTTTEIYKLDKSGVPKEGYPIPNELGYVPLIKGTLNQVKPYQIPISLMSALAPLNKEHYNCLSEYDEERRANSFATLVYERGNFEVGEDENDKRTMEMMALGNTTAIGVPYSVKFPMYVQPQISTLQEKRSYMNDIITTMHVIAGLKGGSAIESQVQSGIALAMQYNDASFDIATMASELQTIEQLHWDLIKAYDGGKSKITGLVYGDIYVKYPVVFDLISDEQKLAGIDAIKMNVRSSKTVMKQCDKELRGMYLPMMTDDDVALSNEEMNEYYENEADLSIGTDNSINGNTETVVIQNSQSGNSNPNSSETNQNSTE